MYRLQTVYQFARIHYTTIDDGDDSNQNDYNDNLHFRRYYYSCLVYHRQILKLVVNMYDLKI